MSKPFWIAISVILLPVALLALLAGWPFDFLLNLVLGWVIYLWRVVTTSHISWGDALTTVICLIAFTIGLQRFLAWLYPQAVRAKLTPIQSWHVAWTVRLVGLVIVLFVSGIAAVGVTHQMAWLVNSPERLTTGGIRDAANQSTSANNLKRFGIAAHNWHDSFEQLPAGALFDAQGTGLHGWHTILLPYMEQDNLYRAIDFKKPWNHPANLPAIRTDVKSYRHPSIETTKDENDLALSHYASNVRVLGGTKTFTLKQIADADGTSNTLFFGEVNSNFKPWGHYVGWRDPALGISSHPDGFGGPTYYGKEGAQFTYVDGSVRYISAKVSREVLKALSTPDGGEKIPADLE